MTIGLPYSGKSQLAKEYRAQGWKVIERDSLLKEIVESPEFQTEVQKRLKGEVNQEVLFSVQNEVAIGLLSERVRQLVLSSPEDRIIYDGTNLQKASRAGILELSRQGVRVDAVVFHVPLTEIFRRAETVFRSGERKGSFNEGARHNLERMIHLTEDPDPSEGFNHIEVREWKTELEDRERKELHHLSR